MFFHVRKRAGGVREWEITFGHQKICFFILGCLRVENSWKGKNLSGARKKCCFNCACLGSIPLLARSKTNDPQRYKLCNCTNLNEPKASCTLKPEMPKNSIRRGCNVCRHTCFTLQKFFVHLRAAFTQIKVSLMSSFHSSKGKPHQTPDTPPCYYMLFWGTYTLEYHLFGMDVCHFTISATSAFCAPQSLKTRTWNRRNRHTPSAEDVQFLWAALYKIWAFNRHAVTPVAKHRRSVNCLWFL